MNCQIFRCYLQYATCIHCRRWQEHQHIWQGTYTHPVSAERTVCKREHLTRKCAPSALSGTRPYTWAGCKHRCSWPSSITQPHTPGSCSFYYAIGCATSACMLCLPAVLVSCAQQVTLVPRRNREAVVLQIDRAQLSYFWYQYVQPTIEPRLHSQAAAATAATAVLLPAARAKQVVHQRSPQG